MKTKNSLNFHLPIGSLDAYVLRVNAIPLLGQREEQDLAKKLHQNNDLTAAKSLIMAHLRYVVRVAKNYIGYGLPLADLIQEGNIGLMKAVKRFDPKQNVRLVTFAIHWIKAEIHEYVIRNWRIVKIATTKAQRKLFFNLRSLKKHLGWMTQEEINEIAKDLRVKPETVREMELRLNMHDAAFDGQNEEEEEFAPAGYLEDHRFNPAQQLETTDWSEQATDSLQFALQNLDERSQDIIRARWLNENKMTLQELAEKYQISAERVRQLEKNALEKLKGELPVE